MRIALAGLVACGAPISNAPFVQEGEFLAVLPSMRRHGPPTEVLLAPNADNPVLRAAKEAAAAYEALLDLPVDVADVLREHTPDTRTDRTRVWQTTELIAGAPEALSTSKEGVRGWIRAELLNPVDGDFEMSIRLSGAEEGPFDEVATGTQGASAGRLTWDLAATAHALGLTPPAPLGTLAIVLDEPTAAFRDRRAQVSYGDQVPWRQWEALGATTLAFEGTFEVTDDAKARPGWAVVLHDSAVGGGAEGAILHGEAELPFEACWDAQGTLTFLSGPAPVIRVGSRADCPAR